MKISKIIGLLIFETIIIKNAGAQDLLHAKSVERERFIIQNENAGENAASAKIPIGNLYHTNFANEFSFDSAESNLLSGDSVTTENRIYRMGLPNTTYNCWIYGNSEFSHRVQRGFINSISDSGIVFRVSKTGNYFPTRNWKLNYLNVSSIDKLKFRQKGGVGRGIFIGVGTGFLVGGLLGLTGIPDYGIFHSLPPWQNAIIGGTLFSFPGLVIGGICGSFRLKITINRNQLQYEKYKKVISSYSNRKI